MKNQEDYKSFINENEALLIEIKKTSKLSEDILPFIKVLDYLCEMDIIEDLSERDKADIFQTGYNVVFSKIETIKTIIKEYFSNDLSMLYKFNKNIYYILVFEELSQIDTKNLFDSILDKLYLKLQTKEELSSDVELDFDKNIIPSFLEREEYELYSTIFEQTASQII